MAKTAASLQERLGLTGALPAHVAIIMDGNGRWAKERGLPRAMGHRAGMERLKGIIRHSSDLGIEALSLYAFSTENWKRPAEEVGLLCNLLVEYFSREIDELHQNNVRIRQLGESTPFPPAVRQAVARAEERTAQNTGLRLSIALNYGGQDELLRAARKLAAKAAAGEVLPEALTREMFAGALDTAGLPPVDLLIRTGGDQRISNFLLYQAAYAELYFEPAFWPAFTEEVYVRALNEFGRRVRRFGGL